VLVREKWCFEFASDEKRWTFLKATIFERLTRLKIVCDDSDGHQKITVSKKFNNVYILNTHNKNNKNIFLDNKTMVGICE
jgi:hypothetical protein